MLLGVSEYGFQADVAQHFFQRHDFPFNERLLIFRILVFGIFADVPEFNGLLDSLSDLLAADRFQMFLAVHCLV